MFLKFSSKLNTITPPDVVVFLVQKIQLYPGKLSKTHFFAFLGPKKNQKQK